MSFAPKLLISTLLIVNITLWVSWLFSKTNLAKNLQAGEKICSAIKADMNIAQVQSIAKADAGAFVVFTSSFGVAKKSFCRCGV